MVDPHHLVAGPQRPTLIQPANTSSDASASYEISFRSRESLFSIAEMSDSLFDEACRARIVAQELRCLSQHYVVVLDSVVVHTAVDEAFNRKSVI